jgi:hypothetical protein
MNKIKRKGKQRVPVKERMKNKEKEIDKFLIKSV